MTLIKALKEAKYKGLFSKTYGGEGHITHKTQKAKNGEKQYILTVKYADYTIIDDELDMMQKGAFDTSILESEKSNRKIAACWQHDIKDPIGRIIRFWETDEGAYCEILLSNFDAVPSAKRAWFQVLDGTINQASFGFRYVWDALKWIEPENEGESGYWIVGQVVLHEISLVTLGCNQNTEVLNAVEGEKSLIKEFLEDPEVQKALSSVKKQNLDQILSLYDVKRLIVEDENVEEPEPPVEEQKRGLFALLGA